MTDKNEIVFWLEGTDVKNGVFLGWKWLQCETAAAEALTAEGDTIYVLAEDIFLSQGAAMKEVARLAGI